ncbi:MAG: hypothetical protein H2057_03305 [Alphaproteobacteria bacterium]|nr:hypothetical protein [Alphaproteobacteria bacterium]
MLTKNTLLLSVCCAAKIWATNPMMPDEVKKEHGAFAAINNIGYRLPPHILCANLVSLEETGLASCQKELNDLNLTSDQHAYLARCHHQIGEYKTALYYWQRCVEAGYDFNESDVEVCSETFRAISENPQNSYKLWGWIATKYKASFCPSWYHVYAIAALEADQYDVADQMITRHFLLSEKPYSGAYVIAAQAHLFKGNYIQAAKHLRTISPSKSQRMCSRSFISMQLLPTINFAILKKLRNAWNSFLSTAKKPHIQPTSMKMLAPMQRSVTSWKRRRDIGRNTLSFLNQKKAPL